MAVAPNSSEVDRASPGGAGALRPGWVVRLLPMMLAGMLVGFLELKPQPSLHDLPQLPASWVKFCDAHDFLNNVVGFGGFAGTVHFAFAGWCRESFSRVARRAFVLAVVVVALECLQLFLPARTCDWRDMVAGWLGIALASLPWLAWSRPSVPHGN